MKFFGKVLLKIVALNFVFLCGMSIFRAVFFFYYGQGMTFETTDVLKAFLMGVRFDAATLGYMNIPISFALIALLFVGKTRTFKSFFSKAKFYYTIIGGGIFVFLCVDFGFYSYFQDHLNILAYGFIDDDTQALISTIAENYNLPLIFGGFISAFVLIFLISKKILTIKYTDIYSLSLPGKLRVKVFMLIILGLAHFMLIRQTIHMFPLGLFHAEISTNAFINKTAINGFFTMQDAMVIRAEGGREIDFIDKAGYGDGEEGIRRAFADFLDKDIDDISQYSPQNSLIVELPYNKDIEDTEPNVILIVMESFGSDLIKYNSAEFNVLGELKKHFDEDIVFLNFLPGHHVTIGSLEATIANVARKPDAPYLSQSKYGYKKYKFSGPLPYKAKNYETFFFYGGNMGWRGLEPFMISLGFDNIVGEGSMDASIPRNQWGIYDGYLFDYIFDVLEKGDKKKFIEVLTMTNHPPFSLPKDYKLLPLTPPTALSERILDRQLAKMRFETYQYANEMLGRFITRIKNSKYADNTIIAVTGDHNFWGLFQYSDEELLDRLSVPFYIYVPKKLRPKFVNTAVFGSHMDILPTLYALSLSQVSYMAMGKNLLSPNAAANIATHDSGAIMDMENAVLYDFQTGVGRYYRWDKDFPRRAILSEDELPDHQRLIKHFLSQTAVSDYLIKNTGE
ncbi:MAG: sulfatase-like hydrolase/transferase [Elusimicrobiota bacterium]|jgi:phosphoglycerol transferase MdoB-like AlkP superfamily enzyme|nr:sulfatase-like hydrolase/transferase [Elusimicrobiota bacterium]